MGRVKSEDLSADDAREIYDQSLAEQLASSLESLRGNRRHTYGDELIPVGLPMTKRLHEMGLRLENRPLRHDPTVHRCTRGRWWLLLSISPPAPDSSAIVDGGAFRSSRRHAVFLMSPA